MSDDWRHCGSGDAMVSVCQVMSEDYMTKEFYDFGEQIYSGSRDNNDFSLSRRTF